MSERDELAKLAQDFVDLWQEHVAASATDPALLRWVEAWLAPLAAASGADDRGALTPGAAPAGAAHDELARRLDELAGRLAGCEERLAALERKARKPGRAAAGRTGERRS